MESKYYMKGEHDMADILEKKLKERTGTDNPFRVPEGYFDTLPEKMRLRIARKKRERNIWRWAVAAVMAGCVATTGLILVQQADTASLASETSVYSTEDMEMLLDCNIVSNLEIANYITEAE